MHYLRSFGLPPVSARLLHIAAGQEDATQTLWHGPSRASDPAESLWELWLRLAEALARKTNASDREVSSEVKGISRTGWMGLSILILGLKRRD